MGKITFHNKIQETMSLVESIIEVSEITFEINARDTG